MNEQLEQFVSVISELLASYDDEQFLVIREKVAQEIVDRLNGPELKPVIDEFYKEVDLNGYEPERVMSDLSVAQAVLEGLIDNIRSQYPDSVVKQEFCDMIQSVLESFFVSLLSRLANRDSVNVGVEITHPNAKIPTYAHDGDQGADIYAVEDITLEPHTYGNMIPTGLKLLIPHDWAVSIRPRSGLSKHTTLRISNAPATIDTQYRGKIMILMDNVGDKPYTIKAGERIAQMILERNYRATFCQVDSVEPNTDRGEGGFGSSGN